MKGTEASEFSKVHLKLFRIRTPFLLVVMMRGFVTYQSQVAVFNSSKINMYPPSEPWDPRAGLDGWKISPPTGLRYRTLQPVVSRYTELPGPLPMKVLTLLLLRS